MERKKRDKEEEWRQRGRMETKWENGDREGEGSPR